MKKISLLLLMFGLIPIFTHAVDIEDNVKNYEKNKNWVSFSITDDNFGRVVASRAGTEDNRKNTTLTLTYPTNKRCELMPIDLIIKMNAPLREAVNKKIFGTIQMGNEKPKEVEAILQNESDSEFVFISFPSKKFEQQLPENTQLIANFKGFGVMEFSLDGANSAIYNAKNMCKNFSTL